MHPNFTLKQLASSLIILAVFTINLNAQVTILNPINIAGGLSDSTIQAKIEPALTKGTIGQIFDGNQLTEAGVQNSDSLSITLSFTDPVKISKSKLFFWNNGVRTVEAANSEADLNQKTGSYQMLVNQQAYSFFAWDSAGFSLAEAKIIRLTARNLQNAGVYLGEWKLYSAQTLTALVIQPDPIQLVPATSLQLAVDVLNANGKVQPYTLDEHVNWSSDDRSIATVDEFGKITAHALGSVNVTAFTSKLSGTAPVEVINDFESTNAPTMTIKVALVLQDPVIDSTRNRKIHQVRGWTNPLTLTNQILEDFSRSSDGVIKFQIVETHADEGIFTRFDGELMTIDTLTYFYSTVARMLDLKRMTETEGRVRFDYNAMIDYYDLAAKRNNGEIDEIWVYAHPFASMYESQLVGPGAFWWNSPPLEHPGLEKLLSVMGWNYERGVAEALHSFGHRVESAIRKAYGRWDIHAKEPNNWELFTTIDKEIPGKAHIGNIHFPPNGMSDYDYSNRRYAFTHADNWKRYPILLDQKRSVNCEEWGCSQRGYMRWWLNHLPRYEGITVGILNNWWFYVVDYDGAVEYAEQLMAGINQSEQPGSTPNHFTLEQNYPNPFNSSTKIRYSLSFPGHVSLRIYDILGREVTTLTREWKTAGQHEIVFDAGNFASGVYFYKLSAGNFSEMKKLLLMK